MLKLIKNKLKKWIKKIAREEINKEKENILNITYQLADFSNAKPEDKASFHNISGKKYSSIHENLSILIYRFEKLGIYVEQQSIDISDLNLWLKKYDQIDNVYREWDDVYIQKVLEHYLTYKTLGISSKTIVIDIAASNSIFADELNLKRIEAYKLDLEYPKGTNGIKIGADAGNTGLEDEFADILTLHCAYECFMGEADTNFIKEAERILKPGGKVGVTPLYVDEIHSIITSPYCDQNEVIIDKGAKRLWRDDKYKEKFSRHYSPEAFYERVYSKMPQNMNGKIIFINNIGELLQKFPGQIIYPYFMFIAEKKSK